MKARILFPGNELPSSTRRDINSLYPKIADFIKSRIKHPAVLWRDKSIRPGNAPSGSYSAQNIGLVSFYETDTICHTAGCGVWNRNLPVEEALRCKGEDSGIHAAVLFILGYRVNFLGS